MSALRIRQIIDKAVRRGAYLEHGNLKSLYLNAFLIVFITFSLSCKYYFKELLLANNICERDDSILPKIRNYSRSLSSPERYA